MHKHFENQDPLSHVMGKRAEGMLSLSESHGSETPGHFAAATDALRETALILLILWLFLPSMPVLVAFGLGWLAWKVGRSGWLGWARLERLHNLIEQEKYEIEHHRPQERDELVALYGSKGFEGKLLDDVVDVLMADQDRLLKVMLEEEMGLTLQAFEHPLKQSFGAAIGALISLVVCVSTFVLFPAYGMLFASFLMLIGGAIASALRDKNRVIPAVIWNVSVGALAFGVAYFVFYMIV